MPERRDPCVLLQQFVQVRKIDQFGASDRSIPASQQAVRMIWELCCHATWMKQGKLGPVLIAGSGKSGRACPPIVHSCCTPSACRHYTGASLSCETSIKVPCERSVGTIKPISPRANRFVARYYHIAAMCGVSTRFSGPSRRVRACRRMPPCPPSGLRCRTGRGKAGVHRRCPVPAPSRKPRPPLAASAASGAIPAIVPAAASA
jgi:hypothetical protein